MERKIGVVIADDLEFLPFVRYAQSLGPCPSSVIRGNESVRCEFTHGGRQFTVIAVKCGIGKVNAASAAAFLIADEDVELIINAGLSGGVRGVRREDIVIGSSYVEADFDLTAIGFNPGEKPGEEIVSQGSPDLIRAAQAAFPGAVTGRFGCGDFFLNDEVRKKAFAEEYKICSFDMESGAIAAVCRKCGIPFVSVRKISDDAGETAAEDYRNLNEWQEQHLYRIVFDMFEHL